MEQDKQLKKILANSADGASPDFTSAVMERVNGLSAKSLYYQPLVSPKWQRLFLLTFVTVAGAIFALCFIIAFSHISITSQLQSLELGNINYDKIVLFIILFWMMFSMNALLQKKLLFRKG